MAFEFDPTTELSEFNDSIRVFRTELFTPGGCGNKVFKLTKNLQSLKKRGCRSVLSFGGAWSNHLHAFAIACKQLDLRAVAAVRGEEQPSNELLRSAVEHDLVIHYLSRKDYRKRFEEQFAQSLSRALQCDAWLPEGGSNDLAVSGCKDIAMHLNKICDATHIVVAVGTGATLAGIANGAKASQKVIGVPVVQDDRLLQRLFDWTAADSAPWELHQIAEPAQYAKADQSLLQFVIESHHKTGIVLDPVYNGKALRAIQDSGFVNNPDNKVVYIHTGGVGGCLGFKERFYDDCDSDKVDKYLLAVRSLMSNA